MENKEQAHVATLRLMGESISIKTTDNDKDFVAEVIDLVSERIDSAETRMKSGRQAHQIVLLALLDLAEEYVRAKRRTADYKSEIDFRIKKLLNGLETGEAAPGAPSLTFDLGSDSVARVPSA